MARTRGSQGRWLGLLAAGVVACKSPPPAVEPQPQLAPHASTTVVYAANRLDLARMAADLGHDTAVTVPVPVTPTAERLAPPSHGGLRIDATLAHGALAAAGGDTAVRVQLRASDALPGQRNPQRVVVVDASAAMAGRPWHHLCNALRHVAGNLTAGATLRLIVAQSPPTWTAAAAGPATARQSVDAACALRPDGPPALSAAVAALANEPAAQQDGAMAHLLVLGSTRQHLVQPADPAVAEALGRWQGPQRTVSAMLVGPDADPGLLGLAAAPPAAPVWWARDPSQLGELLGEWVDATAEAVATAVDVRVFLAPGVERLAVGTSEATTPAAAAAPAAVTPTVAAETPAVRWQVAWMRRGDQLDLGLGVRVAAGQGRLAVARIDVGYRDVASGRPSRHVSQRGLDRSGSAAAAARPDVMWTAWATAATATLAEASATRPGPALTRSRDALRAIAAAAAQLADAHASEAARGASARLRALSVWADRLDAGQLRAFQAYCHLLARWLGTTTSSPPLRP